VPQSLVGNFWHFGSCGAGFWLRSLVAIFQFPFRGCRDRFDSRQRAVYIRHERLLSILTRCRQPKLLHRPRSCFPGPRQAFRLGCPTLGSSAAQGSPSSRARCGDPRRRRHRGRGEGAEGPGRRCAACYPRRRRGRHLAGGAAFRCSAPSRRSTGKNEDEGHGIEIVKKALSWPARQICDGNLETARWRHCGRPKAAAFSTSARWSAVGAYSAGISVPCRLTQGRARERRETKQSHSGFHWSRRIPHRS
jgi:hypothetical protein